MVIASRRVGCQDRHRATATASGAPWPNWYAGRDNIATFLIGLPMAGDMRWRMVPTWANAQPAIAGYLWDEDTKTFIADCFNILTLRGREIEQVTAFLSPGLFAHFDLPASIAA